MSTEWLTTVNKAILCGKVNVLSFEIEHNCSIFYCFSIFIQDNKNGFNYIVPIFVSLSYNRFSNFNGFGIRFGVRLSPNNLGELFKANFDDFFFSFVSIDIVYLSRHVSLYLRFIPYNK